MEKFNATIVVTQEDVEKYAALTGDFNPIHFDETFAKSTPFKKPIIHGPLLLAKITSFFANDFPGPGTVYLGHEYKFLKPVYVNECVTVEFSQLHQNEKNHLFISTKCFNQDQEAVFEGIARLKKF
jgi:3-hydroxybutyryl-CoA dehydratase